MSMGHYYSLDKDHLHACMGLDDGCEGVIVDTERWRGVVTYIEIKRKMSEA